MSQKMRGILFFVEAGRIRIIYLFEPNIPQYLPLGNFSYGNINALHILTSAALRLVRIQSL